MRQQQQHHPRHATMTSEWEDLLRSPTHSKVDPLFSPRAAAMQKNAPRSTSASSNAVHWEKNPTFSHSDGGSVSSTRSRPTSNRRQPSNNSKRSSAKPSSAWKQLRESVPSSLLFSNNTEVENHHEVPTLLLPSTLRRGKLSELCAADKAKVGALVQELIKATSEKEELKEKLSESKTSNDARLSKLKSQNDSIISETQELRKKFSHSLDMLRAYQQRLVALQKSFDEEKSSKLSLEKLMIEHQDRADELEREASKLRADLVTTKANHKKEVDIQLTALERQLEDSKERLKEERRQRMQEQKLITLKLNQQERKMHEELEKHKLEVQRKCRADDAGSSDANNISVRVESVLDAWADRLKEAFASSGALDTIRNSILQEVSMNNTNTNNNNDDELDINPSDSINLRPVSSPAESVTLKLRKPRSGRTSGGDTASRRLFHTREDEAGGGNLAKVAPVFDTFLAQSNSKVDSKKRSGNSTSSTTRKTNAKIRNSSTGGKRSVGKKLPTPPVTPTNNKKTAKRVKSPLSVHKERHGLISSLDASYDWKADSAYHERALYDIVDRLESNEQAEYDYSASLPSSPGYYRHHCAHKDLDVLSSGGDWERRDIDNTSDTASLGKLSAKELAVRVAVESDMQDFIDHTNSEQY